jgi:hypothetical protein
MHLHDQRKTQRGAAGVSHIHVVYDAAEVMSVVDRRIRAIDGIGIAGGANEADQGTAAGRGLIHVVGGDVRILQRTRATRLGYVERRVVRPVDVLAGLEIAARAVGRRIGQTIPAVDPLAGVGVDDRRRTGRVSRVVNKVRDPVDQPCRAIVHRINKQVGLLIADGGTACQHRVRVRLETSQHRLAVQPWRYRGQIGLSILQQFTGRTQRISVGIFYHSDAAPVDRHTTKHLLLTHHLATTGDRYRVARLKGHVLAQVEVGCQCGCGYSIEVSCVQLLGGSSRCHGNDGHADDGDHESETEMCRHVTLLDSFSRQMKPMWRQSPIQISPCNQHGSALMICLAIPRYARMSRPPWHSMQRQPRRVQLQNRNYPSAIEDHPPTSPKADQCTLLLATHQSNTIFLAKCVASHNAAPRLSRAKA